MKFIFGLLLVLLICSCEKQELVVDYSNIRYNNMKPFSVVVDSSQQKVKAMVKQVSLRYSPAVEDTLNIRILEFLSDVYAMDYYMNSGRFQGSAPILRGDNLEQSIRSGSKIFIFSHDHFRRYPRTDLEQFVQVFPGYRGGSPQEFLSLPFEHRKNGRTSIQTKYFLGIRAEFPVILQSYRDNNLEWNVARSWEGVSSESFDKWVKQLHLVEPVGVETSWDEYYFTAGNGSNGVVTRLAGGRVACAWGYLSWQDLIEKFHVAANRIYEARF